MGNDADNVIDVQLVGLCIWLVLCLCACVIRFFMGSRSVPPPVPRPSNDRSGFLPPRKESNG